MTMSSTHTAQDTGRYWWLGALPHYDDVTFLQNPNCAVAKSMIRSTADDPPEAFYLACKLEKTVFTAGESVKGKLSVYVDKSFPCQRLDIYLKCICFLSVPKSTAKHKRSASAIYTTANVWTAKGKENYHMPYGMSTYVFDLQLPRIVRASTADHVISVVYAILVDFHQTGLEAHDRLQAFAGYVKIQSQPYIERSISQSPTSCSDTLIVLDRSGLFLGGLNTTMSLKSCLIFTKSKIFIQVNIQCEHIKKKFKLLEIFPALIQETVFIGEPTRKCQRAIVYLKNDSRNNIARKKREIRHTFEMDVGDIIPTTFPAEQESNHRLQVNYFMILLIKHEDYNEYNIVTKQQVTIVHTESYKVTTKNCEEPVRSLQVNEERKEQETSEHPELGVFNFGPSFENSTMHLFFLEFHAQLEQVLPLLRELNSKLIYVYSFISLGNSSETCEEWTIINNWLRYYQDLLEPTLMGIDNIEGIEKVIQETISNFYKPWLLETHFSPKPHEVIRNLLKDMISKITEMIDWILNKESSVEGPQLQQIEISTSHSSHAPIPFNACKLWFGWTTHSASRQSKSILVKTFIDEAMINELNLKNMFYPPSSDLTQVTPYEQSCQFFSLDESYFANNVTVTNKAFAKIVSDITGSPKASKSLSLNTASGTKVYTKTLPAETQSANIEIQDTTSKTRSETCHPNGKKNDSLDFGTQSVIKRKILTASKKQRSRSYSAIKKMSQNIPQAPISDSTVGQAEEKVDINSQAANVENVVVSLPNALTDTDMSKETKYSDNQSILCQTNEIQNTHKYVSSSTRYLKHKNKAGPAKSSKVQDMKSTPNVTKEIRNKAQVKKNTNSSLTCQTTPSMKQSAGSTKSTLKKTSSPEYKEKLKSKPTHIKTPVDRHSFSQTEETVSSAKVVQTHQTPNVEPLAQCYVDQSLTHSAQASYETNVETSSETNVETSSETNVETSSETNVETSSETNVETSSETNVETSSETNVETSSETNVETSSETNVETSSETNVETSSETNVETSSETNVETSSETNVETSSETNVETSSETNVETSSETNVETSSETNVETSCETNVETSSETNVDTSSETNVETSSETNVETSSVTNVETSSETNVETSWETNVETSSKTNVETSSKTNVETSWETNVETSWETNVETSWETNVETSSETNAETSWETNVETSWETNVETSNESNDIASNEINVETSNESNDIASNEINVETSNESNDIASNKINVETSCKTNVETSCETNVETSSETNVEISSQIHNSDSPKNINNLSTLTQNINSCIRFPLLANAAPLDPANNGQLIQSNIQAQRADSEHVVSSMNNSETKSSKESRINEVSSKVNATLKSHMNRNGKPNEPQSMLLHLTENNSFSFEDFDKVGCSESTNKLSPQSASKMLVQPEMHNSNTDSLHLPKSSRALQEISSYENSINSSTKGVNKYAHQTSTKKTKIADRLWTLSRKSSHGKSSNLKEDPEKGVIICVEQKNSESNLSESGPRHNINHSLVNSVQKNGMQLKTDNDQDAWMNMTTKFRSKLLFEGSTFDGKSQSCDGLSSNCYKNIKKTEASALFSELPLIKKHRIQNPLVVTNTSLQEKGYDRQEIKRWNEDSTGAIKPGYNAVKPAPVKVTESVQKYKHLDPVPVSKTHTNSQVFINEKHKQLTGLNITKQHLPSHPLKQLYRPFHENNFSQNISEPVTRTMDKRGKHLPVPMARPNKLLPADLMTMSNKPLHEPLKLLAVPNLGQKCVPKLPDKPQNEPRHKSNIPVSLQRHKLNKVKLLIDQPLMLAACPVTGGHLNGTNNVMAIPDGRVTPPSGRCTPLEELKFFLFGLADDSQNKEVNSKGVNESEGPFRVPCFEKDEETLWGDSIINNINLQHTGIWSHNVCNMWATNFNYGDSQSISARPDINKVTNWKKTASMPQSKLNPAAPAFILSGENLATTQRLYLNRERQTMPWKSDEMAGPMDMLRVLREKYAVWVKTKQNAHWDASSLNTIESEITTLCRLLSSQLRNNKTALHLLDYFMQRIHNSNISVQPIITSLNCPQVHGHPRLQQFAQENLPMTVFNSQDLQYAENHMRSNDFHVTNHQYPLDSGPYWLDYRPCQVNQVHGSVVNSGQLAIGYIPTLEYQQNPMLPFSRTHL